LYTAMGRSFRGGGRTGDHVSFPHTLIKPPLIG